MKKLLTSLTLGVTLSSATYATVLLSDSFNYELADNTALTGNYDSDPLAEGLQPTGQAPTGTWTAIHQTGSNLVFKSAGLTHSLVTGSGGALNSTGSSATATGATRTFDPAALPTTDGNVYWGRILIDFNDILPTRNLTALENGLGSTAGDAVRLFSTGGPTGVGFEMFNFVNESVPTAYIRPTIGVGGSGTTARTFGDAVSFDHTITNLIVFKITFGATDEVELWVNPTSIADLPSLGASSSVVSSSDTSLNGSTVYFREDNTAGNWFADEFVLGTTFADIALGTSTVPESSTFASLAGLGALAFAALRRRRVA